MKVTLLHEVMKFISLCMITYDRLLSNGDDVIDRVFLTFLAGGELVFKGRQNG